MKYRKRISVLSIGWEGMESEDLGPVTHIALFKGSIHLYLKDGNTICYDLRDRRILEPEEGDT